MSSATSPLSTFKKILKTGFRPLVQAGKSRLRHFVVSVLYDEVRHLAPIVRQVQEYQASSEQARQGYYQKTQNVPDLKRRFLAAGIPIEDARIDVDGFAQWLHDFAEVPNRYRSMGTASIEKCLEHYLAWAWLNLSTGEVYLDVAASGSNWADVLNHRGIKAYRLDLKYPPGIHGMDIGADAGAMGLPDGFARAMSLQCAYETFQGDADIRFIHEVRRVLDEAGRFAILPLYTDDVYFILSSPYTDLTHVPLDQGARRVWREDSFREPFSRHYSPEAFAERIYSQLNGMKGKIIHFTNLDEVEARYPGQRIYCHFMFFCEK
ncbi:MAG: hypothetical protein HC884_11995 [Chloroflexaceae bacterium]|nr:hypothetical protein [Chloroflexaceae bacterium]